MCVNEINPIMQGTTPAFYFNLPSYMQTSLLTDLCVSFAQRNKPLLEKHLSDATITGERQFKIKLTQTETLGFRANDYVTIQVRILYNGEDAFATMQYKAKVYPAQCKEVLD